MKTIVFYITNLLLFNTYAQGPNISYTSPHNYSIGDAISPLTPSNTGGAVPAMSYGEVTTIAGILNVNGATDGAVSSATFYNAKGITIDASGTIYVADTDNYKIRKITPSGFVSTVAGSGISGSADGLGTTATFNSIYGITIDASGTIYVADNVINKIRKITSNGMVTTFAGSGVGSSTDGLGTVASFNGPIRLCHDSSGNLYVVDMFGHKIREVSPTGMVSTIAGSGIYGSADGVGTAAQFYSPRGVVIDALGNLYILDTGNYKIRKINPAGLVTTLAGSVQGFSNGTGTAATFYSLNAGITIDALGNLYVGDSNRVRKITPQGVVTYLAGGNSGQYPYGPNGDGIGERASFYPNDLVVDTSGHLFMTTQNQTICKISIWGYSISPDLPAGLSFDGTTGTISGTPTIATNPKTYTINAYNGLGTSTATTVISTSVLDTDNFSNKELILYPNPARTSFTIQTPNNINLTRVIITDTTGKVVLEQTQNTTQVNVEQLAYGMYIVQAFSGEEKFTCKFVKE